MAFLDNSGDIILDAVLTDLGRARLAQGNFRISSFALGDEEINYALWNSSDSRGSAFYDLEVLQTPLLEALTSDQSMMKSRLITLPRNNILYMPIFKINDKYPACAPDSSFGGFNLMADNRTFNMDGHAAATGAATPEGYLWGTRGQNSTVTTHISIDQGIDSANNGMSIATAMPTELKETAFIIKLDHRLLVLDAWAQPSTGGDQGSDFPVSEQFIDDDSIASYYLQLAKTGPSAVTNGHFFPRLRSDITTGLDSSALDEKGAYEVFKGPLGSVLRVTPRASNDVRQSESLFDELGTEVATNKDFRGARMTKHKYIDTIMSVTGVTTGYTIDVPIRIIKGTAFSAIS